MNMLVKYLVLKMKTLDGNKDSAAKLTTLMNKKCMQQNPKSEPSQVNARNQLKLLQKTYLKYMVLKFR